METIIPYHDPSLDEILRNCESCTYLRQQGLRRLDGYSDCDSCPTYLHCVTLYDAICERFDDKPIPKKVAIVTIHKLRNKQGDFLTLRKNNGRVEVRNIESN